MALDSFAIRILLTEGGHGTVPRTQGSWLNSGGLGSLLEQTTISALQVLQDRKVPMTCPEMIDVMATEGLWVSPGGKTSASTLYAAIGRSIKDEGKASAFRKTERGKFEAKIVPKV